MITLYCCDQSQHWSWNQYQQRLSLHCRSALEAASEVEFRWIHIRLFNAAGGGNSPIVRRWNYTLRMKPPVGGSKSFS